MWRAADKLGVGVDSAAQAAGTGLVEFGVQVRFRHPLVRSAIYRAASAEERRSVHRALAEATYPEADPERRAWHRAQATVGPDEGRRRRSPAFRGPRPGTRWPRRGRRIPRTRHGADPRPGAQGWARACRRARHAASRRIRGCHQAALRCGGRTGGHTAARTGKPAACPDRASVRRGREATQLLLEAARQLEPLDVRLARETYLEALFAAMFAGPLAGGGGVREAAEAARAAPVAPHPPHPADLLLDGLAIRFTEGYAAGVPTLRRALAAFRSQGDSGSEGLRWLWHAQ